MRPISTLFKSLSNSHCLQNGIQIFLPWHKLTRILLLHTSPTSPFLIPPRIPIFWPKRATRESSVISFFVYLCKHCSLCLFHKFFFLTCPATRYPFRLSQGVFSETPPLTENAPIFPVAVHMYAPSIDLPPQLNAENWIIGWTKSMWNYLNIKYLGFWMNSSFCWATSIIP